MLGGLTPAEAAFPGQNGKIAFSKDQLYTVNPDGTGQTTLVNAYRSDDPAWSPDGTQVAFVYITCNRASASPAESTR